MLNLYIRTSTLIIKAKTCIQAKHNTIYIIKYIIIIKYIMRKKDDKKKS